MAGFLRFPAGKLVFLPQAGGNFVVLLLQAAAAFFQTGHLVAHRLPLGRLFLFLLPQAGGLLFVLHPQAVDLLRLGGCLSGGSAKGLRFPLHRIYLFPNRRQIFLYLGFLPGQRPSPVLMAGAAAFQLFHGGAQGVRVLVQLQQAQAVPLQAAGEKVGLFVLLVAAAVPFVQLLLQFFHGPGGGGGLFLRLAARLLQLGKALGRGFLLPAQGFLILRQGEKGRLRPLLRRLQAGHVLLRGRELRPGGGEGGFLRRGLLLGGLPFRLRLLFLPGKGGGLGAEPLNFRGAAQQAGIPGQGAAGEGAAGVYHLAVQGHNAEPVGVPLGNGHGAVQILRHGNAPQQRVQNPLVFRLALAQLPGQAHKAGAVLQALLPQKGTADGGNRQEGGAAGVPPLQKLDGKLGVPLGAHHNILHGGAQGGFHRHRVLGRHLQDAGNRPVDPPQVPPAHFPHDGFHTLRKAFHAPLQILQQAGPAQALLGVQAEGIAFLFGFLGPPAAAFQPQLPAADRIFQAVDAGGRLLPHGGIIVLLFGQLRPAGVLFRQAGLDSLPAQAQLLRRGGGCGGGHPGFGGGGGQVGDFPGKIRNAAAYLVHAPAQLCQGVLAGLPELLLFGGLLLLPEDLRPFGLYLLVGAAARGGGLLHLALQTSDILFPVKHVVFQHRHVAVPAGGGLLPAGGLLPELVRPGGAGGAFLKDPVNLRVHRLNGLFRLVVLGAGHQQLVVVFPQDTAGALQSVKPQADFQRALFRRIFQELLRLGSLLLQGAHPLFQFGENIPQAQEIFLCPGQPRLGFLLPVAEAGNPCGLFKNLPPVLAAGGHHAVDFSLPDHGVAVPAQAGIHKQLVDVLQAHRRPVQQVFAFAGAVVPPGNGHLVPVEGKAAVPVVHREGYLRKALGLPVRGSVENKALHPGAAKRPGGLLPQDPADRVGNIAFSAAVRPHNRGHAAVEGQRCFIRKGFEAL